MNRITLLPLADYQASCEVLDFARLASSLRDARFFLRRFQDGQTPKTPPALMWHGYVPALASLGLYYAAEVRHRTGSAPSSFDEMKSHWEETKRHRRMRVMPYWFGLPELHASHRSWLVKQDRKIYKKEFPDAKPGEIWFPKRKAVT